MDKGKDTSRRSPYGSPPSLAREGQGQHQRSCRCSLRP